MMATLGALWFLLPPIQKTRQDHRHDTFNGDAAAKV
jgi:hypothetical protein